MYKRQLAKRAPAELNAHEPLGKVLSLIHIYAHSRYYIYSVSYDGSGLTQLYQSETGMMINSPVGVDGKFYWVEYPDETPKDLPWAIMVMNISTGEVETFRSGESKDEMLPPILRLDYDKITWVENCLLYTSVLLSAVYG